MTIQALLFDKDGTLFDFSATWHNWTLGVIEHFASGNADLGQRIADAIDFDLAKVAYRPSSPIIAGTNREAAELVASALTGADVDAVEIYLSESAAKAPLAPVVPLNDFLGGLQRRGYRLGVVTNDSEHSARAHLTAADATGPLDFIAGHDSGFGVKPDPDPLLAFSKHVEIEPAHVAMVGDSTHDLIAGRRAGMRTVGVLTGLAPREALAEFADVVLPDISHLPDWLNLA